MSLTILQTPEQFQPVLSNGLFFTVSADTTNTFKFRYVYDLYVNGVYTFEGKASPNPSGVAVLDLQQILENECFNNPIASWNGTPIYTHTTFPFSAPYLDETILYSLKIFNKDSKTYLKMSFTSSREREFPIIYLSKISGISPNITLCLPIRAL
jgi:hypothetical protein